MLIRARTTHTRAARGRDRRDSAACTRHQARHAVPPLHVRTLKRCYRHAVSRTMRWLACRAVMRGSDVGQHEPRRTWYRRARRNRATGVLPFTYPPPAREMPADRRWFKRAVVSSSRARLASALVSWPNETGEQSQPSARAQRQNAWREATSLASVPATHLTVERVEQSILYQV